MESQVRQNYHRDCEAAINRMVNMEMFASYTYTSMVRKSSRALFCFFCFLTVVDVFVIPFKKRLKCYLLRQATLFCTYERE